MRDLAAAKKHRVARRWWGSFSLWVLGSQGPEGSFSVCPASVVNKVLSRMQQVIGAQRSQGRSSGRSLEGQGLPLQMNRR